ncbi:kit ligand a precursor [Takifugu rubripes]|uniref:Kit ligand n=1 Tax=Takifugu rubripes TaxID=31033 RepID=C1PGH3_TAKRU|nr:kit ligand a precursor [Takifugu rubripes]BAH57744.1 stem cell factor [Takifugu rubripes]|eukprot:NP_001153658.1 stem cell factor precursor [Takifugu rubripes]
MKKSKIRIRICVHLLLFITLGVHSTKFDVNPVTDDISRLSVLKNNIPKDYKIPLDYIPKATGGICWVKLNVFCLENSLHNLSHTFGNISSNRKDLSIFIKMFQELRFNLEPVEPIMYEFDCHYRKERWQTAKYFDLVKEFLIAAQNGDNSDDCEPPPCPTSPRPVTTEEYLTESSTVISSNGPECTTGCTTYHNPSPLSEVVERSLLSLLFIPLLALVFLLVWKVRSRRNREDMEQDSGERGCFTGAEGTASPLDADISEKNNLSTIETV